MTTAMIAASMTSSSLVGADPRQLATLLRLTPRFYTREIDQIDRSR
jgi:hypothetical protein